MKTAQLRPEIRGLLYVLTGAMTISIAPLFVKVVDAGPNMIASYRMMWGGVVLLAVALLRKERLKPSKALLRILLWSAAFFSGDLILWHQSILYVGPGLATILTNFQVFFLALYATFFLKEQLGWKIKLSIPLALVCLWLLMDVRLGDVTFGMLFGIATGAASAIFYAAFIITLRDSQTMPDRLSPLANMCLICFFSTLFSGLAGLICGEDLVVRGLDNNLLLVLSGVGCQAIGWILLSKGLPLMQPARAGLVMMIQPTLSFAWDVLLFGRPTSALGYLGAAGALFAISLGVLDKKTPPEPDNPDRLTESDKTPETASS